jgi:hypothetical protein
MLKGGFAHLHVPPCRNISFFALYFTLIGEMAVGG